MSDKKRFAFLGSPNIAKSALLTIHIEAERGNKHAQWLIKKMTKPECRCVDCLECIKKEMCCLKPSGVIQYYKGKPISFTLSIEDEEEINR